MKDKDDGYCNSYYWNVYYRPSCGKVMVSQACVKNSVHGGGRCLPRGVSVQGKCLPWGRVSAQRGLGGGLPRGWRTLRWPLNRAVRILLECILVWVCFATRNSDRFWQRKFSLKSDFQISVWFHQKIQQSNSHIHLNQYRMFPYLPNAADLPELTESVFMESSFVCTNYYTWVQCNAHNKLRHRQIGTLSWCW